MLVVKDGPTREADAGMPEACLMVQSHRRVGKRSQIARDTRSCSGGKTVETERVVLVELWVSCWWELVCLGGWGSRRPENRRLSVRFQGLDWIGP